MHKARACRSPSRFRRHALASAALTLSLTLPATGGVRADELRPGALEGWWLSVEGGAAFLAKSSTGYYNATAAAERMFREQLDVSFELGGWYFQQRGRDALGGSFSVGLLWHLWRRDRGSFFLALGGGVLATDADVPQDGLSFNFLPRAGLGGTWRPGAGPARLRMGVRWQHISNAGIKGWDDNPGRDALMLTLAVTVPIADPARAPPSGEGERRGGRPPAHAVTGR